MYAHNDEPSTITVLGQEVAIVEKFVSFVTQQLKALLIYHVVMPLLVRRYMQTQSDLEVKKLYFNHELSCICCRIIPAFCPCTALTAWQLPKVIYVGLLKIDALNQWCLRKVLGIKLCYHVRNDEVRRTTK